MPRFKTTNAFSTWATVGSALACAVAAAHYRVIFLDETFVLRDAISFYLPSRELLARTLAAGRVPEWFDGVGF